MLLLLTADSSVFTNVTPASAFASMRLLSILIPLAECDATPMLLFLIMFSWTDAMSAPVKNAAIWLFCIIKEVRTSSLAPVANTPAWNPLIMPGPLMVTLSSETPIPTFELSAPGPYIPKPFKLIVVASSPTINPSPVQLRFAVNVTFPCTTCPHATVPCGGCSSCATAFIGATTCAPTATNDTIAATMYVIKVLFIQKDASRLTIYVKLLFVLNSKFVYIQHKYLFRILVGTYS